MAWNAWFLDFSALHSTQNKTFRQPGMFPTY